MGCQVILLFDSIMCEPSWHRNLRRDRHRARTRLQLPEVLSKERLYYDISLLQRHHGSQPPDIALRELDFRKMNRHNGKGYATTSGVFNRSRGD